MRTRFLNTDYFFSAQSQLETLKNFNFYTLTPPILLFPQNPQVDLDRSFSNLDSEIKSEIDSLPFAAALSDFVSGVIPQFISDEIEKESDLVNGEIYDEILCSSPGSRVSKESEWMSKLEFEILEMEFPLRESSNSCEEDEAALMFDVPCIKTPLDTVDIEMGVTVTCPWEVVKSICAVELILDCFSVKDNNLPSDKLSTHATKIHEFEVNEINLGLEVTHSIEDSFSYLLPHIDQGHAIHSHEMVVNAKELLGSANLDILEHFSANDLTEQFVADEPTSVDSVIDMNVINLNGRMVVEENSAIQPLVRDENCSLQCSVHFQEVQILDIPTVQIFEQFNSSQAVIETDISDKVFKDDIDSVGSFYESIVSSELALVDETFKSLPVPIFTDNKDVKLESRIFGDMLCVLKPHALTASDNLYLDWHLLLEETCTLEICSTYISMLHEVTYYNTNSELLPNAEDIFSIKSDFIDDYTERPTMLECKEVLTELQDSTHQVNDTSVKSTHAHKINSVANSIHEEKETEKVTSEKVTSLFKTMSQSNDLNFFLDARRGTVRKGYSSETMKKITGVTPPVVFMKETPQPSAALLKEYCKQWDIVVHEVSLSDHILGLVDNIQKSYLAILNHGTDLKGSTLSESEDFEFLSLSKGKLVELITEKSKSQSISGSKDETFMGLLALYAIKQLTYILCFFGVHAAHAYISNLTRQIDNLVIRLRPLESLMGDACQKSESQIFQSHPSLSLIEEILKANMSQNGKSLIISERLFWGPLKQKLTSMQIKFHEVGLDINHLNLLDRSKFTNYLLETLLQSDCLLISHENVLDSFPFNKFSIILEYGGSCASSRIFPLTPKLNAPRVHFLKVNMENHSLPKALCEGFDVPCHLTLDGVPRSMPTLQGILSKEHVEEVLSVFPIEKTRCISSESGNRIDTSYNKERLNESRNYLDTSYDKERSVNTSDSLNLKSIGERELSSPDVVIVVNTQNFEKKMLISRRSSYQKVLALEKEGAQVVERDSTLPFDLIFSAAVCLVWYETRNLGDNFTATSSIPMFMETIATNVLMALSFAFSGCILIFEGETSFLSAIMESSDALYAAAASLDLNLQLFCTYTPESTDEIILSCIRNASKLNRGIFPPMPESETLAESFLTKFPSTNPLSAHAIISSGGMLIEFLEWSPQHRIQAIAKYQVPDGSIHLFDVLCRYGEMGESKSVMTDCSSTDSDISNGKLLSEIKRRKHAMSSEKSDLPMDDSFYVDPLNQTKERIAEFNLASQPHHMSDFFHLQDNKKAKNSHLFTADSELNKKRGSYTSREADPRTEPYITNNLHQSKSLFDFSSHRIFTTSEEPNSNTDIWTSAKDRSPSLHEKIIGQKPSYSSKVDSSLKRQREVSKPYFVPKGNGFHNEGKTSQSKTTQSSKMQHDMKRAFEFFQGTRDAHQHTLACNTCISCPGSSRNTEKSYKKISPSVIDSFKYRGEKKMPKNIKKWRKGGRVGDSSNIKNRKEVSFVSPPTWTPVDKRARQNLSFSRTGNEKQSKLVWTNRYSPNSSCILRKRQRDAV